ncbi:MAG: hypothetical protein L6R41_005025 [Letrouitia leprolyta]|nr:MAG: hypothetical protein L6R41_005025 [Letrouitia leprolyta]
MHQQANVERIPSKELAKTPKLKSLWKFINYAFNDSVHHHLELGFDGEHQRFDEPEHIVEEMGPNGVTFIHYAPGSAQGPMSEAKIIATAGCKPWSAASKMEERLELIKKKEAAKKDMMTNGSVTSGKSSETPLSHPPLLQQLEYAGSMEHVDGHINIPRWEVMAVCVHPEWQKQGLAEKLLGLVTEEVSSQVKFQGNRPEFKLVVRTMKEYNEEYWLSKGFGTVAEKYFEPGSFGASDGFHMLDMTRDHRIG